MVPGLVQGEPSSKSVPLLQLLCRWGETLKDPVSATFRIEDVHDPSAAATTVVATTSLGAANKLGTGRYALPTGDTSGWNVGTHRAVCEYVMSAGGPTHTHILEFEVLDPLDWTTGVDFLGLATTRDLYLDEYVASTVTRRQVHRWLNQWSWDLEAKLGRRFGPRYMVVRVSGRESPMLLLPEALLAIEKVEAVWKDSDGEEVTYEYDNAYFRVLNRHLDDPMVGEDDRYDPRLEITGWTDPVSFISTFDWPWGRQNVKITGVWGFTDPTPHPSGEQVPWGRRPRELTQVLGALVSRSLEDPTMTDPTVWSPGSIQQIKTRDQSLKFGGGSGGGGFRPAPDSPTGDPALDRLLLRFMQPVSSDYSGKEEEDL